MYSIDYQETFASVAKMNIVRILLSIAANQNWTLHQMDINSVFLQETLEEDIVNQTVQSIVLCKA
jgi:Reverse transcriptase (RNA-dependent DNA polymerase)